jgi:alpha-N-arabinofuranosidase
VKIACLAQLVNVIAPIMSEPEGGAWRQTIFYPFLHATSYGRGTACHVEVASPKFDCQARTDVACLDSVAVYNEEKQETTLFILNRSLDSDVSTEITVGGAGRLLEHLQMAGFDLKAVNSLGSETVKPQAVAGGAMTGEKCELLIPKASWNVLRFA